MLSTLPHTQGNWCGGVSLCNTPFSHLKINMVSTVVFRLLLSLSLSFLSSHPVLCAPKAEHGSRVAVHFICFLNESVAGWRLHSARWSGRWGRSHGNTSVLIVEVPQHGGGTAQLLHCSLGVWWSCSYSTSHPSFHGKEGGGERPVKKKPRLCHPQTRLNNAKAVNQNRRWHERMAD